MAKSHLLDKEVEEKQPERQAFARLRPVRLVAGNTGHDDEGEKDDVKRELDLWLATAPVGSLPHLQYAV